MTQILKGKDQLQRSLMPILAKAIAGCEKHEETELHRILIRWQEEAVRYLFPSAAPVTAKPDRPPWWTDADEKAMQSVQAKQSSHVATANVNVEPSTVASNDQLPIDPELAEITKFYVEAHNMSEEDAAMQAAKDLNNGLTLDVIMSQ